VSFICGKTGFNVGAVIDLAESLFEQSRQEVSTGRLNQVLQRAEEANPPGTRHNKRPRLYYATQVGVAPPTFLVFASYPQLITEQYTRFLMNHLRSHLGFEEVPVRTVFRARERKEMRGGDAPKGRPHSLTKHLRPPEARERGQRRESR